MNADRGQLITQASSLALCLARIPVLIRHLRDGQVITASSDATVRIWDGKTCECLQAFRPPQAGTGELAVNSVHLFSQNLDHIVVCNRSSTVFIMTMQGQVGHSNGVPSTLALLQED